MPVLERVSAISGYFFQKSTTLVSGEKAESRLAVGSDVASEPDELGATSLESSLDGVLHPARVNAATNKLADRTFCFFISWPRAANHDMSYCETNSLLSLGISRQQRNEKITSGPRIAFCARAGWLGGVVR